MSNGPKSVPATSDACSCMADLDEPGPMHSHTCGLRTETACSHCNGTGKEPEKHGS